MDEEQVVEDALQALRAIMQEYRNEEVGLLAGSMAIQVRGPIMMGIQRKSFDPEQLEERKRLVEAMRTPPEEFIKAVAAAIEKRKGPGYKTPVFKCGEDYERCKKHGDRKLCLAMLIICLGKHLIPFTK